MTEADLPGDRVVHMQLDVARRGTTLTGQVNVDGVPAKHFTGWIGLNAAIDGLLVEQQVDAARPIDDPGP